MMPFFGRVKIQRPELNDFWRFLERLHKEREKKKHGVENKLKQISKVDILSSQVKETRCKSFGSPRSQLESIEEISSKQKTRNHQGITRWLLTSAMQNPAALPTFKAVFNLPGSYWLV